jgi:lysophospholipase L1-like esterase
VTNVAAGNRAPVITAGPQATPGAVTLPGTVAVSVTASDADGDALTYAWSKTTGPGTVSFANPAAAGTTAAFSAAGSYTLQVTVSDGQASVGGSVNVSVSAPSGGGNELFTTHFDSGSEQFVYSDDAFLGTSRPAYASGSYAAAGGFSGGGLRVTLGGVDASSITNGMSGGWSRSFNLASSALVTISLRYRMQLNGGYEPDECSQVMLAVDGVLLGSDQTTYLYRDCGPGDGSPDRDSGWRQAVAEVFLSSGSHTLTVGGWNGQKTYLTEITEIFFDDISLSVDDATTVYYQDNFNSGTAANWQVIDEGDASSGWQVSAGRLTQTQETVDGWENGYHLGSLAVYTGGYALSDYVVQATARALAPADGRRDAVGLFFRYQNSDNYYRLILSRMQGVGRLEKKLAGVFSTLAHDGQGFEVGQDLSIRIVIQGSAILVYINDLPRFGAVDTALGSGTIALFTQGPAEFDNVLISAVSATPKTAIISPVGDQVAITDAAAGPYSLSAAATAINLPSGGGIRFTLNGNPATDRTDFVAPFEAIFSNVPAGTQHSIEAVMVDSQNQPLDHPDGFDYDLKAGIGVGGRYLVGMGDSITNGAGDNILGDNVSADGRNRSRGYTPILNDKITARLNRAVTVMNEGIGGATSAAGLSGFSGTVARHVRSQIWMVLYGSNDANSSLPIPSGLTCSESDLASQAARCRGTYKANLRQIVLGLKQAGKVPVLGLVPYHHNAPAGVDDMIQEYNQVVFDLVAEHGLPADPPDFYGYFADNPARLVDNLHPDGTGYAAMAQMWYDALLNAGLINP